ncbi:MAG: ATP-binding cassette domain-containing protein, partial [Pseudomonadota bacterium]
MAEALLEIEGLQSGYGDVQVLWDVSLAVAEGEIACVVGSNGAGKTTLLRTVSGLIAPRAGRIRFAGEEIGGAAPD